VNERRVLVPGEAAQLPALTRFLREFWSAAGLPAAEALCFELALEELFTNVVRHGAPGGPPPAVELSLALAGPRLTMTLADDGPAFDPLALPQPDVGAALEDRPVGGLGVFLVRQMMDTVSYRRAGPRNELCLTKRVAAAAAGASGADFA